MRHFLSSCHLFSCHVLPRHVMSCHVMLMFCQVGGQAPSCRFFGVIFHVSHLVASSCVMSCRVIQRLAVLGPLMSYLFLFL